MNPPIIPIAGATFIAAPLDFVGALVATLLLAVVPEAAEGDGIEIGTVPPLLKLVAVVDGVTVVPGLG